MGWHGYDNPAQNCWTIEYLNEHNMKKVKRQNRMKKKKSKQVDKITKYVVNMVKEADSSNSEADAQKFK